MKAKTCFGEKTKKYCTLDKPPTRDPFNPFCKGMKDPPPKAGAGKAVTTVVFLFMALSFCLLL